MNDIDWALIASFVPEAHTTGRHGNVVGLCLMVIDLQQVTDIRQGIRGIDAASGFLDAGAFKRSCEGSMTMARNLGNPVCLAVIQMNWFDRINTKWGAESSDGVLSQVAYVLRGWPRDCDLLGRLGEDRFGILLIGAGSRNRAQDN